MFTRGTKLYSQILAVHSNSGNNFHQQRKVSRTTAQYKKQLEYVDIPDEVEEVDVTIKCTTRKAKQPKLVNIPSEDGALVHMSFGDRDGCDPKPVCKKFTLQCPQTRPNKRPLVKVCIGKKRKNCKLIVLAVFLAALVAGYTYMTMSSREGDEDSLSKCLSGKDECECCTEKEATVCCTFVEEPEE